jgi:phosphoketolase
MSGEFAVRELAQASSAIQKFRDQLQEHRDYVRREGNDPPDIQNWTWSRNGASAS